MNRLDWLAADPATFDWPPDRNRILEARAATIAEARFWPREIAYGYTDRGGLQVPAAAVAPASIEIPIDPAVVAAIARGADLDWWELRELRAAEQLQARDLVTA